MNNRFKFRVWFAPDWQKPKMIYEAEHTYDNRCRNKGSFHHESFGEILEDKDCIVMQSTGLKDKNGKLIYEGDIVGRFHVSSTMQGRVFTGFVEYDDERGRYCIFENKHRGYVTFADIDDVFEVIGNIYENKELLNDNSRKGGRV